MKYGIIFLFLAGCSSQPTVRIQYVNVPTYIPSPATLTAPTQVILGDSPTWGSALGAYKAGVDSCNADKAALGGLRAPIQDKGKPPYKLF